VSIFFLAINVENEHPGSYLIGRRRKKCSSKINYCSALDATLPLEKTHQDCSNITAKHNKTTSKNATRRIKKQLEKQTK